MPNVTVLIPAHNAGRTITAALRSVLSQTYDDYEIIVVDDGSTDDTALRVAEFGPRVSVISQANGGPAHARNTGLRAARGQYIAFLNARDVWLPRKLERQAAYLVRHPDTALLHGAALRSPAPVAAVLETKDEAVLNDVGIAPRNIFCDLFHRRIVIHTSTVIVSRAALDAVGYFDERRELEVETRDLWVRIAARHLAGYMPVPVAIARSDAAVSSKIEKTYRGEQVVIAQSASLCESSGQHRHSDKRCVVDREHELFTELGAERFWSGRVAEAKTAFRHALQLKPKAPRARLYLSATYMGRGWFEPVRRLRRTLQLGPGSPAVTVPNLIHDTTFRRARSAAVRVIHRVDDAVAAIGRTTPRILFEAASPMSLAVYAPVLAILQRDPRVELWFTTSDGAWDASSVFTPAGITERVIPASSIRWMKFDAYINTDFWNMTWLPRRCCRIHLFHGVAGKYGLDAPTRIAPVVATFDRLLFPNRDRLDRYADAGLVDADGPAAALVGYPKVDCLVDGSLDRAAIEQALGLDPSSPTVLYAPTWSPHSSLNASGESIIRGLARLGVNVIVKLHDRSFDPAARASGGVDWRTRIEQLCAELGVHMAQNFDASPYLFVADALVTDHSSVGFEYMLLDRPVVVIDCPDLLVHARVSQQKVDLLRSAADVVPAEETADAVRRALADPMRHSARRRAIASDLFYCPGRASVRAAEAIYGVLALSAPDASVARDAAQAPATFSSLETTPVSR